MKSRYAKGRGKPPLYVSAIQRNRSNVGIVLFSFADQSEIRIPFSTHKQLLAILEALMREAVPLSVGWHCPGPADEVAMLISAGHLKGTYTEISWSAPEHYIVREIAEGALEWEEAESPTMIANMSFNPDALRLVNSSALS